ncbi:type II secretion system protein [Halorhodospira neutriphila]|uniref:Prepilin-type N-terminal cleavage/methylation domain-containing protein n=1 Tax=Halorhodospira neutriphila TaxID=168379 RepID=A0ABS1E282_9GAMM|nr:prepilin-type N-terminal cleavage/methylation domain-containing protein [Halorhodospira neutriphila]MBK1725823.1 hypothetical protein [Halorhodospira neutriphila]
MKQQQGNGVRHRQGGFTLVELSVVLVIVGLLLGAVFAGQELIKNAQATRLKNQVKNIETMAQNFRDQRGRYPGDCNNDGIIGIAIGDGLSSPDDRAARAGYLSTDTAISLAEGGDGSWEEGSFCPRDAETYEGDAQLHGGNPGANLFYNDLKEAGFINETSVNRDVAEHTDDDYIFAMQIDEGGYPYNVMVIAGVSRFLARAMDESIDGNADDMDGGRIRGIQTDGTIEDDSSWSDWSSGGAGSPDSKVHVAYFFEDVPTD